MDQIRRKKAEGSSCGSWGTFLTVHSERQIKAGDGRRREAGERQILSIGRKSQKRELQFFSFLGGNEGKSLPASVELFSTLLSSSPAYFFFGDYGTMCLPLQRVATRRNDPNTAAWRRDWLGGTARGAGPGWRAAPPNPHIALKIQTFA